MATRAKAVEPVIQQIIVKKIIADDHGGHHGGAWKVAYADFVTAMMAFFLLMWLLGMTDEEKRKGLADYFTPTLVELKQNSAGSNGLFGGQSIVDVDNYPHRAAQTGKGSIVIPQDATGGPKDGSMESERMRFHQLRKALEARMNKDPELRALRPNVSFIEMKDGLRIDLVDQANFSMFSLSTDALVPRARKLVSEVAKVLGAVPNDIIVRGHTDALPYASGKTSNNWLLSSMRAEATRQALAASGVATARFARIEGVADREPFVASDRYDPRNRRMSIIVAWRGSQTPQAPGTNPASGAMPVRKVNFAASRMR